MRLIFFLALPFLLFPSCQSTEDTPQNSSLPAVQELIKEKNRLKKVARMLVGQFSNAKDSAAVNNPYVQQQLLEGEAIWTSRSDAYWVHLKWMHAKLPEQPMADLILKFTQAAPDTILLQLFPTPVKNPDFKQLSPRDLTPNSRCAYRIVRTESNTFRVLYNSKYCLYSTEPSPLPYFDVGATLTPETLFFGTRFFDKEEKMKIEYKDYRYERQPEFPEG